MNPFEPLSKCHCSNCGKDQLWLVDRYGHTVNYPKIIDNNDETQLETLINELEFDHMQCKACGKHYKISWANGWPEPLTSTIPVRFFLY